MKTPLTTTARLTTNAKLTTTAKTVLERRYLMKDTQGNVLEDPDAMFRRVAAYLASKEEDPAIWENAFYEMMAKLEFLPNSPTLMNAGRFPAMGLSGCFVLPVGDSMDSIFHAVGAAAMVHKSGGGTGFSFSNIRPAGDTVGSTGGVASGPVSFMGVFDAATETVKQGSNRRGANMGVMSVDHPDILTFIRAKNDGKSFSNFNLSVAVTDAFMDAVMTDTTYPLVNPRNGEIQGYMNAKFVYDEICKAAWSHGDPGVLFIDKINNANTTPSLGRIASTNPCGELPLLPYESCNLGSINLAKFVKSDKRKKTLDPNSQIDWTNLEATIRTSVRFLDNVIEGNSFPFDEIWEATLKTRKIGLGVMGFADMLLLLGVPYNSQSAVEVGSTVMAFVNKIAASQSNVLAEERGVFPAYGDSTCTEALRNAARTTIAPTGTLSIIAGCSSGIEPLFALSYKRRIMDNEEFVEVHPIFEKVARSQGFYSKELMSKVAETGSVFGMDEVPSDIQKLFVTAHDVDYKWHLQMQAAFQRHTDNAVSKTINLRHDCSVQDIKTIYWDAWNMNCKGVTVYRDGSKEGQVLSFGPELKQTPAGFEPRHRPRETQGTTKKVTTGCGDLYITVNYDDVGMCEIFSTLGSSGSCSMAQLEAITRLVSLALRSGIAPAAIVKSLAGIRCSSPGWNSGGQVLSCPDGMSKVIESELTTHVRKRSTIGGVCPECRNTLVHEEGCDVCKNCGYSRCG